jgi:hypothetical protein
MDLFMRLSKRLVLPWRLGTLPAMLLVIDGLLRIAIRTGILLDMLPISMAGHGNARGHQKEGAVCCYRF